MSKSLVIHIRSTQVSKSLRKQMVAWIVSTRSTVSQNKTINEKQPSVRFEDAWLFSCFFKYARKIPVPGYGQNVDF